MENRRLPAAILADTQYDYSSERTIVDDVVPSHFRTSINLTGGAGSLRLSEGVPVGSYWLVDRITVTCDTGGSAVVTVYENTVAPSNAVSGGNATVGLGVITGAFNPSIPVPPNEDLVISLSGVVGLSQVTVSVWYRLRHFVQTADEIAKQYSWQAAPSEGEEGIDTLSDVDPPKDPDPVEVAAIDDGSPPRLPMFEPQLYLDDVTMR